MTFCVDSRVSNSSLHEGVAKTWSAEPPVYSLLTLYIDTFPQSLLLIPHTLGINLIWLLNYLFILLLCSFEGRVSLCSPGWDGTHYVDHGS